MSALEKTHFHVYERSKSNKEIFRCTHPLCRHYDRREFLFGKRAECPKCHNLFELSKIQLKNKTPVCEFCSKSKEATELRAARDLAFEELKKKDETTELDVFKILNEADFEKIKNILE